MSQCNGKNIKLVCADIGNRHRVVHLVKCVHLHMVSKRKETLMILCLKNSLVVKMWGHYCRTIKHRFAEILKKLEFVSLLIIVAMLMVKKILGH